MQCSGAECQKIANGYISSQRGTVQIGKKLVAFTGTTYASYSRARRFVQNLRNDWLRDGVSHDVAVVMRLVDPAFNILAKLGLKNTFERALRASCLTTDLSSSALASRASDVIMQETPSQVACDVNSSCSRVPS